MTLSDENPVFEFELLNLPDECLFDADIRENRKNRKTPEISGNKTEMYLEELFNMLRV